MVSTLTLSFDAAYPATASNLSLRDLPGVERWWGSRRVRTRGRHAVETSAVHVRSLFDERADVLRLVLQRRLPQRPVTTSNLSEKNKKRKQLEMKDPLCTYTDARRLWAFLSSAKAASLSVPWMRKPSASRSLSVMPAFERRASPWARRGSMSPRSSVPSLLVRIWSMDVGAFTGNASNLSWQVTCTKVADAGNVLRTC